MLAVIISSIPTLFMFPTGDSLLPVPQSRLRMLILREVATIPPNAEKFLAPKQIIGSCLTVDQTCLRFVSSVFSK